MTIEEIHALAYGIRKRVLHHVIENGGGYLSQACSAAEMLAALYGHILRLGASQGPPTPVPFSGVPGPGSSQPVCGGAYNGPKAPELDRLIFSPVHYSLVLYATLIELDRLAPEALSQFNRDGSTVEMIGAEHSPGIDVTAGSLAQALSQAAGIALARKLRGDSGRVWVFMSDGEFQEGQTWETIAAAAYHQLELRVLVDANAQQCDGAIADVMTIEPLVQRLRSFGAQAVEVDGHDVEALVTAAAQRPAAPYFVIGRTDPCRGIDLLRQRGSKLHYVRFKDEDERQAYRAVLQRLQSDI